MYVSHAPEVTRRQRQVHRRHPVFLPLFRLMLCFNLTNEELSWETCSSFPCLPHMVNRLKTSFMCCRKRCRCGKECGCGTRVGRCHFKKSYLLHSFLSLRMYPLTLRPQCEDFLWCSLFQSLTLRNTIRL